LAQSTSALIKMRAFFAASVLSWIEYRICPNRDAMNSICLARVILIELLMVLALYADLTQSQAVRRRDSRQQMPARMGRALRETHHLHLRKLRLMGIAFEAGQERPASSLHPSYMLQP
jgi:uncharacterized membrane protein